MRRKLQITKTIIKKITLSITAIHSTALRKIIKMEESYRKSSCQ
jgi:hypothetical protein